MAESGRWFSEEELGQMSRPTMDRAIEALEAGDTETALELCRAMRHEWRFLHDVMAESMLGLVTYVQQKLGDEGVGEAWEESLRRGWKRDAGKILERSLAYLEVRASPDLPPPPASVASVLVGYNEKLYSERTARIEQ